MSLVMMGAGLAVLVLGAELLVRGASAIASAWGVAPLVVGLTVVAFGTSAPEVAVSVRAVVGGQGDIALGNVVGSNHVNLLLILGLSAVITPLAVGAELVRRDVPMLILVSTGVWLGGLGGSITRPVAALLLVGLVGYAGWLIRGARRSKVSEQPNEPPSRALRWPLASVLSLVGLGLLVLGAGWLVDGATTFARSWGVSELVIGLTIVAVGTSFPELATSIVAALRGQRDLAVGNVVGSNLFNLLGVLGLAGICSDDGLTIAPALQRFDIPLMVGIALLCWPLCRSGFTLTRGEGAYLVLGCVLYMTTLIAMASGDAPVARILAGATWAWLALGLLATAWLARRGSARRV